MTPQPQPLNRPLADLVWRGYDWRGAIPWAVAGVLVSLAILAGRWAIADLSAFADRTGALTLFALAVAGWPALIVVFLYRTVTYTYRLTDRALLIDRGPIFHPEPPVLLSEVSKVIDRAGPIGQWLGIGWVDLTTVAGRSVRMTGLARPREFAEAIRQATTHATGKA